jgi:hypothetical protein
MIKINLKLSPLEIFIKMKKLLLNTKILNGMNVIANWLKFYKMEIIKLNELFIFYLQILFNIQILMQLYTSLNI